MRKTKSEGKTVGILIGLRNSHCEIGIAKIRIAKFRIAKKLPANFALRKNCQHIANFCFAFSLLIFNICSKICTKLLKLKQEKLHKGTN